MKIFFQKHVLILKLQLVRRFSHMALQWCLLLILFLPMFQVSSIDNSDSAVLIDFKNHVTKDPNGVLDNWSPAIPFCNWTGVTCHPKHPLRVWWLDLSNQSLSGTIAPSLGKLVHLEALNLQLNNFTGTIPAEIGNCTSLWGLGLGPNSLSGEIPDVFQNLQRLAILYLWGNNLHGGIPLSLGNCTRLKELELAHNALSGIIPDMFHKLQHISFLDLFDNNLDGHIPASIGNCSRLQEFKVNRNALNGIIPSLFTFPELKVFNVWGNQLEGQIPSWLANCTNLENLQLSQNNLSGQIPPALGVDQNKLKTVNMRVNRLSGPIPLSLANFSSLEVLDLSYNSLIDSIPSEIGRLSHLRILGLHFNQLTSNIPDSLGNLTSILSISLSSNQFHGTIPMTLGSLVNIQSLTLNRIYNLSGGIPTSLAGCTHLAILKLGGNRLEGNIPPELGNIQSLNELYLWGNHLMGEIPSSFGNLSRLQVLDLSYNKLSGVLPDSLANLGNSLVNTFDISSNNLQGNIPLWLGDFDKVQSISLASNNFSGEIPISIKDCKGLLKLNLSSNWLSGTVPLKLGECQSLQILDLSVNNLSGLVPQSLTSLTDLKILNLSKNMFQGPIPFEGAFTKFNSSSFLRNPLLCGDIINRTCLSQINNNYNGHNKRRKMIWLVPLLMVIILIFALIVALFNHKRRDGAYSSHDGGPLKLFTFQQLSNMTNHFDNVNMVGEGSYSRVFKALWDEKLVAIKVMKQDEQIVSEVKKSFLTEAKALAKVKHRNIIKLLGYYCTNKMLALVMEYMPNGSLTNILVTNTLTSHSKLNIAMDVAQAIHYIHYEFDTPIIHCDLKPENVLIDSDYVAKITDFGISKLVMGQSNFASTSNFRGTIGYAPPEYAYSGVVSTMGDVYSYGMLLFVMMTRKFPTDEMFQSSNFRDWVLNNITIAKDEEQHESQTLMGDIERLLIQVGLLCTSANPSSRPTMKEVLEMLLNIKQIDIRTLPSMEALIESAANGHALQNVPTSS